MCTMNNDGLSTLDTAFLAGKFNGAIKRQKRTAAAIRFDGLRMNRTGKTGRKRAALERQIVQELNFDMRNWSIEMSLLEGDQKLLEAQLDAIYPQGQHAGWLEDVCTMCGQWGDHCSCFDDHPSLDCRDEGCPDCGCIRCECDFGHDDYGYDYEPDYRYSLTGGVTLTELLYPRKKENTMTEEDKMKLSDALWEDHEFYNGKNDLTTMSKSNGWNRYVDSSLDCGFDDYGFYAFDDEPVNEFGGLPNHFDPSFDYRTHFWAGEMFDWDFSVFDDDIDFTLRLSPMKARRVSRFDRLGSGKPKRLDRYGRSGNWKSVYSRAEKEIRNSREKATAKHDLLQLVNDTLGVDAPKATQKLRFKSMDEKAEYEARLNAESKRNNKKSNRGGKKSSRTAGGDTSNENVDYSLPIRRSYYMRTREVHVTRIGLVNGERRIISAGIEKMQCRY